MPQIVHPWARWWRRSFPTLCGLHVHHIPPSHGMGQLPWIKLIVDEAISFVTFFTNKHKVLSMYRAHSKLELKKPSSTRFAYMWLLLERLYDVNSPLRQTVVSTMWNEWDESGSDEAKEMQRQILNEEFWVRVRAIVVAVTPYYRTLHMTDMEGATIGFLIHFMRDARKELEACTLLTLEELADLLHIVDTGYEFMRRPIHGLAALLQIAHPRHRQRVAWR